MTRSALLLLLSLWPLDAMAQEAVRGRITDAATGRGIAGAQVMPIPRGGATWSDGEGTFRLAAAPASDSIRVLAIGYAEQRLAWPGEGTVIALAPKAVILPEVVTTGGRWEESAALVTAPISTISADEIQAQAATAVDQIVSQLPGVQSIPVQPAGTSVAIRGIGESRVLVLVDGEPAGGALIENQDLSRLSTLAVERIEITKGPVSSEWGSDALGGVINVITQAPPEALRLTASGRAGSFGRLEGNASVGGTAGAFGYRLSGGIRQQDAVPGQFQGDTPFERVYDARATARYIASPRVSLRADVNYLYERQRWPVGGGFNGFNDNEGVSGFAETTVDALGGVWRARVFGETYEYRYRSAEGDAPYANTGPPPQDERMVRALVAQTRQVGAHTIDAGVQGTLRRVTAPDRLVGESMSDDQLELYARDAMRIGHLLATAGARFTGNSRWGSNVSPSLGAAWEPAQALRLRGSVARGFRAPSFKELGWAFGNVSAGYVVTGNPDLEPESSWSYDLGAALELAPGLVAEVEGFRNDVENLIDFATVGLTPEGYLRFQPINLGQARTQGIEAGVRWSPASWALSAAYTYLDARNLTDDLPLNRRAAHTGRLRATRTWALLGGLRTDVTALYTGAAPLIGDQGNGLEVVAEQGSFLQWNLGFQLTLNDVLEVNTGVDNLFDARPAGWTGLTERRFWIGFRTQWAPGGATPRVTAQREEEAPE